MPEKETGLLYSLYIVIFLRISPQLHKYLTFANKNKISKNPKILSLPLFLAENTKNTKLYFLYSGIFRVCIIFNQLTINLLKPKNTRIQKIQFFSASFPPIIKIFHFTGLTAFLA